MPFQKYVEIRLSPPQMADEFPAQTMLQPVSACFVALFFSISDGSPPLGHEVSTTLANER